MSATTIKKKRKNKDWDQYSVEDWTHKNKQNNS